MFKLYKLKFVSKPVKPLLAFFVYIYNLLANH
jgi:hypothetical protein